MNAHKGRRRTATNGTVGSRMSGPSGRSAVESRGAASESTSSQSGTGALDRQETTFGSRIRVERPSTQARGSRARARGGALKPARSCASSVAGSRDEAICMGLSGILGLRSGPPSSFAVFGVGVRIHKRRKRSIIGGMRVRRQWGVASNKELEQTGSAVANGMGGPCSSIQCSTHLSCRSALQP